MNDEERFAQWEARLVARHQAGRDVLCGMSREAWMEEVGEDPYGMQCVRRDEDCASEWRACGLPEVRQHGNSGRAHAARGQAQQPERAEREADV